MNKCVSGCMELFGVHLRSECGQGTLDHFTPSASVALETSQPTFRIIFKWNHLYVVHLAVKVAGIPRCARESSCGERK